MNPNQMNVAKAKVAQQELTRTARRSRATGESDSDRPADPRLRATPTPQDFFGLLAHPLQGRR